MISTKSIIFFMIVILTINLKSLCAAEEHGLNSGNDNINKKLIDALKVEIVVFKI